ncbi:MAG: TolC family protein, partial [Myxococcota bacterium]
VASVTTQKSELIYKTALAYVDAVLAVRVARLTKLQLASFQKQQSSVKRRLQEGLAHQADLQRAQLDTLTSRSKLLRAQNKQQQKLLQLAAIMQYNKPFAVAQQTQLPAWEFAKQPPQQLAQQAMAQRAKVKDRQLAIEMAKREHAAAWWDLFPSMQATAGVSHAAPLAGGDLQETLTWRAGAALLWSPYKGGTRYGNMRQTRSRIGQQRLQLQALTWEIWQHTHQQHHRLITLQQRVHMAQQAFSTSQQLHRSTVDLYNNGQATVLELSAAERDLANAEIGLAQVRSDLQRAQLDLAYTVGLLQQLTIATKLL